jgi:hypothetical protein
VKKKHRHEKGAARERGVLADKVACSACACVGFLRATPEGKWHAYAALHHGACCSFGKPEIPKEIFLTHPCDRPGDDLNAAQLKILRVGLLGVEKDRSRRCASKHSHSSVSSGCSPPLLIRAAVLNKQPCVWDCVE